MYGYAVLAHFGFVQEIVGRLAAMKCHCHLTLVAKLSGPQSLRVLPAQRSGTPSLTFKQHRLLGLQLILACDKPRDAHLAVTSQSRSIQSPLTGVSRHGQGSRWSGSRPKYGDAGGRHVSTRGRPCFAGTRGSKNSASLLPRAWVFLRQAGNLAICV